MFGEVKTDIYENESHEMFMTARQLGECLGYKNKSGIDMLINRNSYLKNEEFSGTHHLLVPQGNGYSIQETRVFNEDGIYEATFLANTNKAKEFRNWVRQLLKSLRKGDLLLAKDNVTFSPEMFETILNKHLATINNRILTLEAKNPIQPNFWLWKRHIANKSVNAIAEALNIDSRTAYDMVYDNMTSTYGFDKSFAISQFCSKYGIENTQESPAKVPVIDTIADVPEYQCEFVKTANYIINCNKEISCIQNVVQTDMPDIESYDKVQQVIMPLIHKYGDNSPNGSKTYKAVYKEMDKSSKAWKNMQTRCRCKSKKEVLLKCDKYYTEFVQAVNTLLSKEGGI